MSVAENKKYYQVVDQLADLQTAGPFSLAFKSGLELEFRQSHRNWYRETSKAAALVAAVLLGIGHIVQSLAGVWVNPIVEWGRIFTIAMLLLSCLYIAKTSDMTYQNTLLYFNCFIAAAVILLLSVAYPTPFKQITYTSLVFVPIFMFGYVRMPFNQAFTFGLIILIMTNGVLYFDNRLLGEWAFIDFMLICGVTLSLMLCYRQEKSSREKFLKMLLMSIECDQLKRDYKDMEVKLSQDPVTHLLNRRAFENALLDTWNKAFQKQRSAHLLALSISGLDQLNELKGTDQGDALLKAVARQIKQLLIEQGDAAGRISGSSFCILIANCNDVELAKRMDRLRDGLRSMSCLQGVDTEQHPIGFKSGVLTVEPTPETDSRDAMVDVFRHLSEVKL